MTDQVITFVDQFNNALNDVFSGVGGRTYPETKLIRGPFGPFIVKKPQLIPAWNVLQPIAEALAEELSKDQNGYEVVLEKLEPSAVILDKVYFGGKVFEALSEYDHDHFEHYIAPSLLVMRDYFNHLGDGYEGLLCQYAYDNILKRDPELQQLKLT